MSVISHIINLYASLTDVMLSSCPPISMYTCLNIKGWKFFVKERIYIVVVE